MTEFESVADTPKDGSHLVVAFASLEGGMVDQHFGSAQGFFVYDVHPTQAKLITSKIFTRAAKDGNEDKLKPRLSWLVGSDIVYCGSIGGSATRQLMALGVTPMKVTGGPDVEELIQGLQKQMNGTPEFWLSNILNKKLKPALSKTAFDEEWG